MRVVLGVLGCASLGLWAYGYLYVSGLACAFGSLSGTCAVPTPWSLRGEDLMLMVVLPALVPLALFGLALWPRRSR